MKKINLLIFAFASTLFGCKSMTPSPEFAKWASVKTPTAGDSAVYGTYQAGCLSGAKALPLEGTGYYVARTQRQRYYGHSTMINYLTELGRRIDRKKYLSMIVEDISFPRGGPFYDGHNSHQVGLDVDISFNVAAVRPTPEKLEKWVSSSFVENRTLLLPTWGPDQIHLVELAIDFPEVNRIFVSAAIKNYFCTHMPNAPWLYKLRSWYGHEDHIHVRLNCPSGDSNCKAQSALDPKNNSCGSELEWWYSPEAEAEAKKQEEEKVRAFPELPAQCESVLKAN